MYIIVGVRYIVRGNVVVSVEYLRECFMLDTSTGVLYWKSRPAHHFVSNASYKMWNTRYAGEVASCIKTNGYVGVTVLKKSYQAHRVVWAITSGVWPTGDLDHINGLKSDNRYCNLRYATESQNGFNRVLGKNSTTGYKGVSYDKQTKRYKAKIKISGRSISIGMFDTPKEAHDAYCTRAEKEAGVFFNKG